ncbi:RNA-directed DNA polymerase, eukaryota [Tanacetum coccineum]|uniref:RNA-directed DNA polymerase, eukaryota n=1 Tax=Tanacetum coccineum TaxID=301880 RepID=A0ABQ4WFA6_9ASTR
MPSSICDLYTARKSLTGRTLTLRTLLQKLPMQCHGNLKKMNRQVHPRGEIKKIDLKMWNLNVMATKPKTMQDAIEFATELMDKKINTFAERQDENKRKLDNNNQAQQQLPKRQNMAQAYAARTGERNGYTGTLPLCNKYKFHHNGPCTIKCTNCKRVGHLTRDCWSSAATNNQRTLTCYECGNQGHYKSDCPELKNGNQAGGAGTRGMLLALVGGEPNQDLDDMEDNTNA